VGVTSFTSTDEKPIDVLVIGPEAERSQRERVASTRAERDPSRAAAALTGLVSSARDPGANLMEPLIECARSRCTEGEIVAALRDVFGWWREDPRF
jgi:methylmalonyl-CoA mutase N-terminal domain/subunit